VQLKSLRRLAGKLKRFFRPFVVANSFRTVYGPSHLHIDEDKFVVVCLVKDGEFFIKEFLAYYIELGASHIVFIDNGSTDATVSVATQFPNVTVLSCLLPVKLYESDMRRYAANAFCGGGGWCLFADMDEHFDYPGRTLVPMKKMLEYLNRNKYTAVLGQMLDLYPYGDLRETRNNLHSESFAKTHCYFETDSLKYTEYHASDNPLVYFLKDNIIPDEQLKCIYGGVRSRVFGTNNCLTKHPLVRILPGVAASTHPHCSSGVSCADFSIVLKHYKFAGDFANRMEREVVAKTWDHGEAEMYLEGLKAELSTLYFDGISKKYTTASELVDNKFLYASSRFLEWVSSK